MKKKYVLVGASGRAAYMFAKPMKDDFQNECEIVGIFDINPLRIEAVKTMAGIEDVPGYTDFDKMIKETKPDCGIVTVKDCYHHEYIVRLLNSGVDAITEKPMTIDEVKAKEILDAQKATGKKVVVTFNYRFAPYVTKVKEVIATGVIGEILNVDFEYMLDTWHGADYFRRWHANKANSGGLLVHKSTHHFDLVNWWINDTPEELFALGSRRFYGDNRQKHGERCMTCKEECTFRIDMTKDDFMNKLYANCEEGDGYIRDTCLFRDGIDIEDTMSVNLKYESGAFLSYSLIAHSPYEGYKASINGTKGRMEVAEYHSGIEAKNPSYYINIYHRDGTVSNINVPKSEGNHGGGDQRLLKMLFTDNLPDPLGHMANTIDGAKSIMIGICANKSIAEKKNIVLKDVLDWSKY